MWERGQTVKYPLCTGIFIYLYMPVIGTPSMRTPSDNKVALSGRTVLAASTSNIFLTVLDDC